MAFLTESSFRQLVAMSEIKNIEKIDSQFFVENIFDNALLFYFFNQYDLKKLFRERAILSNNVHYLPTYREVPERKDDLSYILELKGKVKYHYKADCSAMKRGFKNFFMPEPVVRLQKSDEVKHKIIVDDIRNWFKINNYTTERYEKGDINDRILTNSFNSIFPDKYGIDSIFISASNHANSQFQWLITKTTDNVTLKESFDYTGFLNVIEDLIKRRNRLCDGKTLQKLSKYDYLLTKDDRFISNLILERIRLGTLQEVSENFIENYTMLKLKKFWGDHRDLKNKAYTEISNYFKWTYNLKEKEFDKLYLENFNLEGCSVCRR